jgi:hypothetical protein
MKGARELYEKLKQITGESNSLFPAIVKQVHANGTCTCQRDEYELFDVLLQAKTGSDGLRLIPTIDSVVLVQAIGFNTHAVLMHSDLQAVELKVNETVFKADENGIEISRLNNSLKDAITLLIEGVQVIVAGSGGTNPNYLKLTQALTKLNNVLAA